MLLPIGKLFKSVSICIEVLCCLSRNFCNAMGSGLIDGVEHSSCGIVGLIADTACGLNV